jgi:uncharacterized Zn finger protein
MTAGKLAAAKPAATTNTFLYRCPIDKTASAVLNVVNQSGSGTTYRVGIRDYDQTLTLDAGTYKFRKGNVVTSYQLVVTPGVQASSLTPGDLVTLDNNNATFRYFDFFKPTATITIPVKVESVGFSIYSNLTGGSFAIGNTVTGANGLTGIIYDDNGTFSLKLKIAGITNSSTSFRVSGDGTNISALDLLNFDNEIVAVSSKTGNQMTVTRAQSGTTAAAHEAGSVTRIVRPTATTTTLSAAITDTTTTSITVTSAASFVVGDYIKIGNEFFLIGQIATNTLTVSRGSLGTTAATALNGATVTRHTDQGYVALQYFEDGEVINNGSGVSAEITTSVLPSRSFVPQVKFSFDLQNTGTFSVPDSIDLDIDRTYRFTQSDSSNTGETLSFENSIGAIYTATVTTNGTAGTSGAYTQIVVTSVTPVLLNIVGVTDSIGLPSPITTDPLYTTIYVYDIEGTIATTNSFDTTTGSNTITTVTSGPYGYVHSVSGSTIKVSLGLNSSAFTTTKTFYESPREDATVRSLATVNSVTAATDIDAEDYLFYGKSLAANTTDKNSSLVIGPGQSLVVYSSAADINYSLNGFEDNTSDYQIYLYSRVP